MMSVDISTSSCGLNFLAWKNEFAERNKLRKWSMSEDAFSEPCQTSKMERFVKQLTAFIKFSILDV